MANEMGHMIEMARPWISIFSDAFLFIIGLLFLALVVVFIRDVTQTKDAVLRNYPVIGHFRYIFSALGEFFRQYFFAMDREEMPFNRAEREWIHRSTKNKGNTIAHPNPALFFHTNDTLAELITNLFVTFRTNNFVEGDFSHGLLLPPCTSGPIVRCVTTMA